MTMGSNTGNALNGHPQRKSSLWTLLKVSQDKTILNVECEVIFPEELFTNNHHGHRLDMIFDPNGVKVAGSIPLRIVDGFLRGITTPLAPMGATPLELLMAESMSPENWALVAAQLPALKVKRKALVKNKEQTKEVTHRWQMAWRILQPITDTLKTWFFQPRTTWEVITPLASDDTIRDWLFRRRRDECTN